MKETHSEIIKEIKKLTDQRRALLQQEENTCIVTYTQGEKPIDTGYNDKTTDKTLRNLDKEIKRLKGILAKSNALTPIKNFDMTIAEGLVYLAQLNSEISRYQTMAEREPLTRSSAAYRNASYEITKALCDIKEAKEAYQETFDLIAKLQMAIDLTNLTTEVDC